MQTRIAALLCACSIFVTITDRAFAFDYGFLNFGASSKISAGAGAVTSEGAPSIFYNPANLRKRASSEVYGELSLMSLRYTYQYPGYATVEIRQTSPVPLLGASFALGSNWTVAFAGLAAPGAATAQKITAVPSRQLGETPVLLDLELSGGTAASYMLGVGVARKITDAFSLGLSMTRFDLHGDLKVKDHESAIDIVELQTHTSRNIPSIGLRGRLIYGIDLGLSADFRNVMQIEAISKNADGESSRRRGKRGGAQRAAAEIHLGRVEPFAELQREEHHLDVGDANDLDPDHAKTPSVHDTLNYIFGSRVAAGPGKIVASYAWYPTSVGDGIMEDRTENGAERAGVAFGNLDALSRNVYGLGYDYRGSFGHSQCGVSHHRGSRSVPESSRGYGTYALSVTFLSCELGWRF